MNKYWPNRRDIKRTFVRPAAQLRYVGSINLVWLAISILILSGAGGYLREAIGGAEALADVPIEAKASLLAMVNRWIWLAILCVFSSAVISIFHNLWYSHRIFGTLVPLTRMIEELAAGRYQARVRYREKDEMQEVMRMMNDLALALEKRHGNSPD